MREFTIMFNPILIKALAVLLALGLSVTANPVYMSSSESDNQSIYPRTTEILESGTILYNVITAKSNPVVAKRDSGFSPNTARDRSELSKLSKRIYGYCNANIYVDTSHNGHAASVVDCLAIATDVAGKYFIVEYSADGSKTILARHGTCVFGATTTAPGVKSLIGDDDISTVIKYGERYAWSGVYAVNGTMDCLTCATNSTAPRAQTQWGAWGQAS